MARSPKMFQINIISFKGNWHATVAQWKPLFNEHVLWGTEGETLKSINEKEMGQ